MEEEDAPWYHDTTRVPTPAPRRPPGAAIRAVLEAGGEGHLRTKVEALLDEGTRVLSIHDGIVLECIIVTKRALNADGYCQVNIQSANKAKGTKQETAYLHHLVNWYSKGEIVDSWSKSISHLCHHPDCIKPDHLVMEETWKNIRRQTCKAQHLCECDELARCLRPSSADQ
jgi:hypothetical protein